MISLETFIKIAERALLLKRDLSEETLVLAHKLSDRNKVLCKPILDFIKRWRKPIELEVEIKDFDFLPEERILVCRLIPLTMALDTNNPAWSSYMLTQAIQAATTIKGIQLTEIGSAFLETFCDYATPLNKVVYNFCIDFIKELNVRHRKRIKELDNFSWDNARCQSTASVAFLRFFLTTNVQPKFVLKTMIALLQNEYFDNFIGETKYLFEDLAYKQEFLECLLHSKLPKASEDLILSAVIFE